MTRPRTANPGTEGDDPARHDAVPAAAASPAAPLLLFDGACGFCTWTTAWLRRRLARPVHMVPWQEADLVRLGLHRHEVEHFVWWVGTDGQRARGHRAAARVLRACTRPWPLVGRILGSPLVTPFAALGYRLVSAVRHLLPGVTPACGRPGHRCG